MRWLIVREDLVYAKDNIGKQQRALDRIALTASDAPSSKEDGACDCDTYECSINVANFREPSNPPEEVNGAGDD